MNVEIIGKKIMMKYSVLITTYNQQQYLQEAIESVFAQDYKDPFQLVVVNDGSDDGTEGDGIKELSLSKTRAYLNQVRPPKHIKLDIIHNQRNLGLQKAFNTGLYYCKGEWVVRLDHDDKLLPNALVDASGFLEKHDTPRLGMIYSNLITNKGEVHRYPEFQPGMMHSCFEVGHLQITRRKALESVNGWRVALSYSADTACVIDLVEAGWRVKHFDKVLVWNRLHDEQYTVQYFREGRNPNEVKQRIVERSFLLRPEMWIEARSSEILNASTHYWKTEALAIAPFCVGNGADLGCGPRKKYPYAVGVDLTRGSGLVPEIVCDVEKEELPFRDESLDYFILSHIVEHFENPLMTLRKLLKKLKKGGNLLLIIPNSNFTPKMGSAEANKEHKWDFTPESFKVQIADKLADATESFSYNRLENKWSFEAFFKKK